MNWKPLFEGITYPFEILCPDGYVRHFPYMNETDAETDAEVATARNCRFYDKPNRLEKDFGECPGGKHTVGRREASAWK